MMTPTARPAGPYDALTDQQVFERIWAAKKVLGKRLAILGHHYQQDDVIQFADHRGDSLGLSQVAAGLVDAQYIVFCGVYFMAETAAMLCQPEQKVLQPVPEALCPMASLANAEQAEEAWQALGTLWGDDLVPITYQNSIAELKAFVGQHGGAVCTSSNAEELMRWGLSQKGHLLFMPDEHLGTNTAIAMGIPGAEIGVWDPVDPPDPASLAHCRVVVWKGFCYVHANMSVEDVEAARAQYPDATLVVHPECPHEVVALADAYGSTTALIKAVEQAADGATIVVGTECHLVDRLAQSWPTKTVVPLAKRYCRTMGMTSPRDLLAVLEAILADDQEQIAPYLVRVDENTTYWARQALQKMLEVS